GIICPLQHAGHISEDERQNMTEVWVSTCEILGFMVPLVSPWKMYTLPWSGRGAMEDPNLPLSPACPRRTTGSSNWQSTLWQGHTVLLHVQRGGDEDNFAEHLTGGIHCHGHYLRPKILTNLRLIETKQKQ
uniref:Uncharacterized protein n=1 Tax=Gadus morhua TaxID=8049 RepID=A0A8C5CKN9_GADMO